MIQLSNIHDQLYDCNHVMKLSDTHTHFSRTLFPSREDYERYRLKYIFKQEKFLETFLCLYGNIISPIYTIQ